jgi:hypothetical protein
MLKKDLDTADIVRDGLLIGIGPRSPADPCHTTVRTGPYTAVRVGYASIHQSTLDLK